MASSSASDPMGLVSNPPTTIVKVKNTAREDMNGKLGIVVQYIPDRSRYLVHLTEKQSQVALKGENLDKANYLDQIRAQYEQMRNDARVRREIDRISRQLPIKLEYAAGIVIFLLIVVIYFLGFSRTMMILSFLMLIVVVIGPDLFAGAGAPAIIQNFPSRLRALVREHVPYGDRIAANDYVLAGLTIVTVVFFVKSIISGEGTATVNPASAMPSGSIPLQTALGEVGGNFMVTPDVAKKMEEIYKLGFDDAMSSDKEYGASLEEARDLLRSLEKDEDDGLHLDVSPAFISGSDPSGYNEFSSTKPSYYGNPPPKPSNSIMSKLNFSSAASLMYIGRTVYEAGQDAGNSWSFDRMRQNFVTLETWKMAIFALSAYRLVQIFF